MPNDVQLKVERAMVEVVNRLNKSYSTMFHDRKFMLKKDNGNLLVTLGNGPVLFDTSEVIQMLTERDLLYHQIYPKVHEVFLNSLYLFSLILEKQIDVLECLGEANP